MSKEEQKRLDNFENNVKRTTNGLQQKKLLNLAKNTRAVLIEIERCEGLLLEKGMTKQEIEDRIVLGRIISDIEKDNSLIAMLQGKSADLGKEKSVDVLRSKDINHTGIHILCHNADETLALLNGIMSEQRLSSKEIAKETKAAEKKAIEVREKYKQEVDKLYGEGQLGIGDKYERTSDKLEAQSNIIKNSQNEPLTEEQIYKLCYYFNQYFSAKINENPNADGWEKWAQYTREFGRYSKYMDELMTRRENDLPLEQMSPQASAALGKPLMDKIAEAIADMKKLDPYIQQAQQEDALYPSDPTAAAGAYTAESADRGLELLINVGNSDGQLMSLMPIAELSAKAKAVDPDAIRSSVVGKHIFENYADKIPPQGKKDFQNICAAVATYECDMRSTDPQKAALCESLANFYFDKVGQTQLYTIGEGVANAYSEFWNDEPVRVENKSFVAWKKELKNFGSKSKTAKEAEFFDDLVELLAYSQEKYNQREAREATQTTSESVENLTPAQIAVANIKKNESHSKDQPSPEKPQSNTTPLKSSSSKNEETKNHEGKSDPSAGKTGEKSSAVASNAQGGSKTQINFNDLQQKTKNDNQQQKTKNDNQQQKTKNDNQQQKTKNENQQTENKTKTSKFSKFMPRVVKVNENSK